MIDYTILGVFLNEDEKYELSYGVVYPKYYVLIRKMDDRNMLYIDFINKKVRRSTKKRKFVFIKGEKVPEFIVQVLKAAMPIDGFFEYEDNKPKELSMTYTGQGVPNLMAYYYELEHKYSKYLKKK